MVPAPIASMAPPSAAPAPSPIRCKALDKKKLVAIGAHGGRAHLPVTANGHVYLFAHEELRARATLLAMPRDGSKTTELGHLTAINPPTALVVDEHAAYFTSGGKLWSLALSGGEPKELLAKVAKPIALGGDSIYGLRCDAERKVDELLRIAKPGKEPTVVASIEQSPGSKKCEYRALAVDDSAAYVSDWAKRRILKLALSDGALTVLAEKQAFPGRIVPGSDAVLFQSSTGIQKVPTAGGRVAHLSDDGAMPFETVAWDARDLYVLHTPAYSERDVLVRLPRAGGKREELEFFRVSDPTAGGGRVDVAVDDQCAYIAHDGSNFTEILARPK